MATHPSSTNGRISNTDLPASENNQPRFADPPSRWNDVGIAVFAFLVAGLACMRLTGNPGMLAQVWIPTSIGLVALVRLPKSVRPHLVAGFAASDILVGTLSGIPLAMALGVAIGNSLEILVGAWLLRRFVEVDARPFGIDNALKALIVTILGMSPVGAMLTATSWSIQGPDAWFPSANQIGRAHV